MRGSPEPNTRQGEDRPHEIHRVWRRHNRDVCESSNRYEPRCGCPLHVQFVWKGAPGVFEGKKLAYQNKWSLETRSWSEAQSKVKDLEKRLKDFAEGKVVPKGMTVDSSLAGVVRIP